MNGKKIARYIGIVLLIIATAIFALSSVGTVAHAAGLVDDTIDTGTLFSKHPLSNYQLDFYVDSGWDWLPWNWGDSIGKSVMYGLYCITNFIWIINLYLSNAAGYVVKQAYQLDFVHDMAEAIGKNIQTIAGVTSNGFNSQGFYVGFLLLLILIIGIYVTYTGLVKRETSKALHAITNFVVVFILSASFIAYAPDYVKKVNEFSSDISTAALDLGTKIVVPDAEGAGKDSVDMIRNNLFSIQVLQPWLLLQYGSSDKDAIGADRVEELLSTSPKTNDGKDREDLVKKEIEKKDNSNLTLTEVVNRLGMVFFIFLFNLGITIFVMFFMAMLLVSQILFIVYAMFMPISLLLSMIPTYEGLAKQAIVKVFNTIMTRAGITLIVTVAFSLSTMIYQISSSYPFFMVGFLQIVVFAGIYFKLGDIMNMFKLNGNDSQSMGRMLFRKSYMHMRRSARSMKRGKSKPKTADMADKGRNLGAMQKSTNPNKLARISNTGKAPNDPMAKRAGQTVRSVLDTNNRVQDKAQQVKENVQSVPVQAAYAIHKAKEKTVQKARQSVADFKQGIETQMQERHQGWQDKIVRQRENVAAKKDEMQKAQAQKSEFANKKVRTPDLVQVNKGAHSYPNWEEAGNSQNNYETKIPLRRDNTIKRGAVVSNILMQKHSNFLSAKEATSRPFVESSSISKVNQNKSMHRHINNSHQTQLNKSGKGKRE